jgi:glycosyltransferase involved in cell wall biosynthesis
MPKVSTIIPTYNAAAYIENAVASALAQEGVDLEVIVIDDGSTDATWQKLERFGDRILKARQQNGGPAKARNHGARLAHGEWLAFLDADDEWSVDKTVKQLACIDEHSEIIYSGRLDRYRTGRVDRTSSSYHDLLDGDIFEPLLLSNFITLSSVMMRKSFFDRLGGFAEDKELIGVEDWDLWLRYAAVDKVSVCREPLVSYLWHAGSLGKRHRHMSKARIRVIRRALALPRGQLVNRSFVRQAFSAAWECSGGIAATTQPWDAMWWYLRSAWYTPLNPRLYKSMIKCCLGLN